MPKLRTIWNRERDLQLVEALMRPMYVEGMMEQFALTRGQISGRLATLSLTGGDARKAKRDGKTPEQFLETSPLYAKTHEIKTEQPELPLDELYGLDKRLIDGGRMLARAAGDNWGFGFLMASGDVLGVATIEGISADGKWLDVELLESDRAEAYGHLSKPIIGSPTDRVSSSILISNICSIFELWNT